MKITGKLEKIFDAVQVTPKFTKREFILFVENEKNAQYSDSIKFELSQDSCDLLDKFKEFDMVEIDFNLRGRKYLNPNTNVLNYFNSLNAFNIRPLETRETDSPAYTSDLPF